MTGVQTCALPICELLTDENIEMIAKAVVEVAERDREHSNVRRIEKLIADNERAVNNLMKALEVGEVVEQITARIKEKNEERKELEKQLSLESAALVNLSIPQVKFFLTHLRDGIADDLNYRKTLVTVLVNAIYLYDDKLTLILNIGDKSVEITEELLDEIEENTSSVRLSTNKLHHMNTLLSFEPYEFKIDRVFFHFCQF